MKKVCMYVKIISSFALILTLTSCGSNEKSTKPLDVAGDFQREVTLTEGDFTASAEMKRCGENLWECTFSSPETIKGMTIAKSSGEWVIAHEGLNYTLTEDNMPSCSMIKLVTGCVDMLIAKSDLVCNENENTVTENGVISGQDFTAEFENSELKEITIAKSITAEFF